MFMCGKKCSKELGAVLIIAGTAIGGSMIALPLGLCRLEFIYSISWMTLIWLLMTVSVYITLDVMRKIGQPVTMAEAALNTIGRPLYVLNQVSILLLFYTLLVAYSSGLADLFMGADSCPYRVTLFKILIFAAFAVGMWKSTSVMDYCNRGLFAFKILLFVAMIFLLVPHMKCNNLFMSWNHDTKSFLVVIPLLFTAFGFHGSAPAVVEYLGIKHPRLYMVFIFGSVIPLLLYILWEAMVSGLLPLYGDVSLQSVFNDGGNIGDLMQALADASAAGCLVSIITMFSVAAILTSFVGVSISLCHFWSEYNETKNMRWDRKMVIAFTFIPSLLVTLIYPSIFVTALGFAAMSLAVIAIITPCLIMFKYKIQEEMTLQNFSYLFVIVTTFLIGCAIISMEVCHLCCAM